MLSLKSFLSKFRIPLQEISLLFYFIFCVFANEAHAQK